MLQRLKERLPGLLLCAALALPAWFLGKLVPVIGGPVFGILFGIAVGSVLKKRERTQAGVNFSAKLVLQAAVVLLGFGLNMSVIAQTGRESLPVILSTIGVSLVTAFLLYRALRLESNTAVLIGVGSSICGGSAIAATAPVIGARDDEIASSVSVIFLFNVVAALAFPSLGSALGMSDGGFALFAGTAVNDTSSVTAAASAWDGMHQSSILGMATVVKLTRTLAIIPITLALALYRAKKSGGGRAEKLRLGRLLPLFIVFFLLASVAATVFSLPHNFVNACKSASKFFIIMAMAAIGMKTDMVRLVKSGGKALLLGFCCWAAIAATSLAMQKALGIW